MSLLSASHRTLAEQADAEQYFINQGYILPGFHKTYWLGLTTTSAYWPR